MKFEIQIPFGSTVEDRFHPPEVEMKEYVSSSGDYQLQGAAQTYL